MMDRETFAKGLFILGANYPEREITHALVEVYYSFLNHLTPAELERAVRKHIARSQWFPKVSDLLQAAREDMPSPREVWAWLLDEATTGQKPHMDAATARALEAIGGWDVLRLTPSDDLKFRFKDFEAVLLERREREQEALAIGGGQKALEKPA